MTPQDVQGAKIIHPNKLTATPAELLCVYAGPPSILLAEDASLIPLVILGGAYSFDVTVLKYRWTLQRPLCEGKDRFIEKLKGLHRMQHVPLGLGFAFNGVKGAPAHAHLRGIWLPNCRDMHDGLSFGAQGVIMDVVGGVCDTPEEWKSPPRFPTAQMEF